MKINLSNSINEAYGLIGKNKIEDGISLISTIIGEDNDAYSVLIHLSSQYTELKNDIKTGILKEEEATKKKNKIIDNLLGVLKDFIDENPAKIIPFKENKGRYKIEKLDIKSFLQKVDPSQVKTIRIICHTGNNMIASVKEWIDDYLQELVIDENEDKETKRKKSYEKNRFFEQVTIQILFLYPYLENLRRFQHIQKVISTSIWELKNEKNINVDFRFYSGAPRYRAIIIDYEDERLSYISEYEWHGTKTRACKEAFLLKDIQNQIEDPLVKRYTKWFSQNWGKKEIRLIIFDFDDTLAETFELQVEAWVKTIYDQISSGVVGEDQLNEILISKFLDDEDKLKKNVKDIFVDKSMSDSIFHEIFKGLSSISDTNNKIIQEIKNYRFELRKKLTRSKAKLFKNAVEVLKELKKNYLLGIISATSKTLITKVLDRVSKEYEEETGIKIDLKEFFIEIIGKYGPKPSWSRIEEKAIQISNIQTKTNIPFYRIIYIGDNQKDYLASRRFGVHFIDARMLARKLGKKSLIMLEKGDKEYYFNTYAGSITQNNNQLILEIEKINEEAEIEKNRLQTKYLYIEN